MANKNTKMIRVTSRGYVTTNRGRIMTPIMSPYRESINQIWNMITVDRADVEEKLPDGKFIKLTVDNFDTNNFVSKEIKYEKVEEKKDESPAKPIGEVPLTPPVKDETHVEESTVDETDEVVDNNTEDASVEESTVDEADETHVDELTVDETDEVVDNDTEDASVVRTPDGKIIKKRNKNRNKNKNINNHQADKPEEVR